jgi:hypothetical protein
VALPDAINPKKYTTYLGLVHSGSSGSLINNELVAKENMQTQMRHSKWDTATGVLLTQGKVEVKQCRLPQFTTKRNITATFHMFDKRSNDKYDLILCRDLLQAIGLDIHYSSSTFRWNNISVTMVPSGYWNQEKISAIARSWNEKQEISIKEILPRNHQYSPSQTIQHLIKKYIAISNSSSYIFFHGGE